MKGWRKKDIATHFGVSTTAVDNWIGSGCPVIQDARGRVAGMLYGDVMEWLREHRSREVRARYEGSRSAEMTAITARCAIGPTDSYVAVLKRAGLSDAAARKTWRELVAVLDTELCVLLKMPDVLLQFHDAMQRAETDGDAK